MQCVYSSNLRWAISAHSKWSHTIWPSGHLAIFQSSRNPVETLLLSGSDPNLRVKHDSLPSTSAVIIISEVCAFSVVVTFVSGLDSYHSLFLSLRKFFLLKFIYKQRMFYLYVRLCKTCMPGAHGGQKKACKKPWIGVTDHCEAPCGYWDDYVPCVGATSVLNVSVISLIPISGSYLPVSLATFHL